MLKTDGVIKNIRVYAGGNDNGTVTIYTVIQSKEYEDADEYYSGD